MNERTIRARPHDFPLDIGRAALLVIDMQNDFCHPDGYCCGTLGLDATPVRAIIPSVQRVVAWARREGIDVIFTKESHRPDLSDLSPSKKLRYENAGYPVGSIGKMGRYLVQGELGCGIINDLQPLPSELELDKPAQSVFIHTRLEDELRDRGVTHLLIAGLTTQCCVLASYRNASDLGFYCLLLEDCCAAFDPAEHQAAIDVIVSEGGAIGWVAHSTDLLGQMEPN